jgi:hypothetical protein
MFSGILPKRHTISIKILYIAKYIKVKTEISTNITENAELIPFLILNFFSKNLIGFCIGIDNRKEIKNGENNFIIHGVKKTAPIKIAKIIPELTYLLLANLFPPYF